MGPRSALLVLALGAACGGGDPDFVGETIAFTTGEFEVAPGTEPQYCYYTDLPVARDFWIKAYHADMLPGSHHFNMFWADPNMPGLEEIRKGELGPCDGAYKFYLAGSQWTEVDVTFPKGIAARIPEGSLLAMEIHYVNGGDAPLPARLDVAFEEADPASVEHELGLYFGVMNEIRIEAGQTVRLRGTCRLDSGANLVLFTSHSHHYNRKFEINLVDPLGVSTKVYESLEWDHPTVLERWDDPIATVPDQVMEWACNYENPGTRAVTGGGSAETDEMCIAAAFYWPRKRANPYCFADAEATL